MSTHIARLPTLEEYVTSGLRIALVGGPKVGKKHVYRKINTMQGIENELRLYLHCSIPRRQFRDKLDELKRLISNTHDLPNPCDHVYVVWYFASDDWEHVDHVFVKELSALCEVIVVIAKGDLRSSRLNSATGKTHAQQLEDAIRIQFCDIPIVHCSDPALNPTFWVPPFCTFGHDKGYFVVQPEKETWTCTYETDGHDGYPVICQDSHTGVYGPSGLDELIEKSLELNPKLHERSIRRVEDNMKRKERGKLWLLVAVGLALLAVVGASMFPMSDDSRHVESDKRLAKL